MRISVVIVTYNSKAVIFSCLDRLFALPEADCLEVIVVDGASPDNGYLDEMERRYPELRLIRLSENVGFSRANNAGFRASSLQSDFVLFLNPDAFVPEGLLDELSRRMQSPDWARVAVASPLLLGYSLTEDVPTGRIDSAGIACTWFGRYYDQGQGEVNRGQFAQESEVAALCGAFMFCRRTALDGNAPDGAVFDERFFMYKEDIELSLRLRKFGWQLKLCPELVAYHCRGWEPNRGSAPSWAIWHSLLNDWRVWGKFNHGLLTLVIYGMYLAMKSVIVLLELGWRYCGQRLSRLVGKT